MSATDKNGSVALVGWVPCVASTMHACFKTAPLAQLGGAELSAAMGSDHSCEYGRHAFVPHPEQVGRYMCVHHPDDFEHAAACALADVRTPGARARILEKISVARRARGDA